MKKLIDIDGLRPLIDWLKWKHDMDTENFAKYKKVLGIGKTDTSQQDNYDRIQDLYGIIGIEPWQSGSPANLVNIPSQPAGSYPINQHLGMLYNKIGNDGESADENGSSFARIAYLKEKLGASDAEAGTGTAFARIKKLETTTITADDLATPTDMEYLFDLYVTHDVDTLQETEKILIVYTHYITEDEKPAYLS